MSGESGNLYSKLRRNPVISAAITQACQLHKPCMHGEKTESSPVTNYKSTHWRRSQWGVPKAESDSAEKDLAQG